MSIKHNFPRQDTLQNPKNIAYFTKNYQNVNSIVKQVQRMNLDITNQNQQLKDILNYLNTSKATNENKMSKKGSKHKQSSSNTQGDFQASVKTLPTNNVEALEANFQTELNQKLKATRKSRNNGTILKQKSVTTHLRLNEQKQSTEKQRTQQYISNYDLLQSHKFKHRKMSKSMKRCQSCSKIYIKQDQSESKNHQHQTTQKKKAKDSLNMSTSVLVLDSKMHSTEKQKVKQKRSQNEHHQKISANAHKIILGSPKNMFSGVVVASSQKSQLKDFFKVKNNKKGSLIISQNKSKGNLC